MSLDERMREGGREESAGDHEGDRAPHAQGVSPSRCVFLFVSFTVGCCWFCPESRHLLCFSACRLSQHRGVMVLRRLTWVASGHPWELRVVRAAAPRAAAAACPELEAGAAARATLQGTPVCLLRVLGTGRCVCTLHSYRRAPHSWHPVGLPAGEARL